MTGESFRWSLTQGDRGDRSKRFISMTQEEQRVWVFDDFAFQIEKWKIDRGTYAYITDHVGFPQHDSVDKAARQATSLPKITDPILNPMSNFKVTINTHSLVNLPLTI